MGIPDGGVQAQTLQAGLAYEPLASESSLFLCLSILPGHHCHIAAGTSPTTVRDTANRAATPFPDPPPAPLRRLTLLLTVARGLMLRRHRHEWLGLKPKVPSKHLFGATWALKSGLLTMRLGSTRKPAQLSSCRVDISLYVFCNRTLPVHKPSTFNFNPESQAVVLQCSRIKLHPNQACYK